MLCQKCKMNSHDNAVTCSFCGEALQAIPVKKTSKLAIAAFILSLCSFLLVVFTAIPAIILAIVSLLKIRKNEGELKGKGLAIAAIVLSVLLMFPFAVYMFDAPPIVDDYTIADFRSTPAKDAASYDLLLMLVDDSNTPKGSAIGLSDEDANSLRKIAISSKDKSSDQRSIVEIGQSVITHEADITRLWDKTKTAREIIEKLSTFDQIADLTEPGFFPPEKKDFFQNLRRLTYMYNDYARLKIQQGKDIEAVSELIKFDSVIRKFTVNARSLIAKLVCIGCMAMDLMTANFIVNNAQTSPQAIDMLAGHFTPLKHEQTSLRNEILNEYLGFKKNTSAMFQKLNGRAIAKQNSSYRLYRNICNYWIAATKSSTNEKPQLKVWPSFYPELPTANHPCDKISFLYKFYNPTGSFLITLLTPAIEKVTEIEIRLEVHNDLFQIALNKRLGKEVNFTAREYSDKYIVDKEKEIIFSPGPDGKPYTKDDIKLPFDPNVIKF